MEKRTDLGPRKTGAGDKKSRGMLPPSGREQSAKKGEWNLEFFREARFFLSGNRATLTFFTDQEVASIHYDLDRDEIFYRGHNVKNMTLNEKQWEALQKFSDYLGSSQGSERLNKSYHDCLERLLSQQIK